jgi:transposase
LVLAKIERLLSRLELVLDQIAALERERDAVLEVAPSNDASRMIQRLCTRPSANTSHFALAMREPSTKVVRSHLDGA